MHSPMRIFILLSCCIHLFIIALFTENILFAIQTDDPENLLEAKDTVAADQEQELLDIDFFDKFTKSDSSFSLFRSDSLFDGSDSSFSRQRYLKTDTNSLKRHFRSGKHNDSLLAMSELLRTAALKQLLKQMVSSNSSGRIDWNTFSKRLTEILKNYSDSSSEGSSDKNDLYRMLANDEELIRLWREMVMKSVMEMGMEKLGASLRKAISDCFSQMQGSGSGGKFTSGGYFPRMGSGGSKGLFDGPGIEKELANGLSNYFGNLNAPLLSYMASLLGEKNLEELLKREAYAHLVYMTGNDSLSREITAQWNIADLIRKSLEKQHRAGYQTEQFLGAFQLGFGEEISALLENTQMFDEEGQLAGNKYRQLAANYLDLLNQLGTTPNQLLPNLEQYAKAALDIRNRRLKESGIHEIGRGNSWYSDSAEYFLPEMVVLNSKVLTKRKQQSDTVLANPSFFTHAWGGAVRISQPVTIDGILDEWRDVIRYRLPGQRQGPDPIPSELQSCNFLMVQWDNQALYCAYEINDVRDNECLQEIFWESDALELFIDPQNFKDTIRIDSRNYQFWVWPRLQRAWGYSGESVFINPQKYEPRLFKIPAIRVASQRNGNRYTCETRIDMSIMKNVHLLPGKIVGFNYSINNGESVYLRWVTDKGRNVSIHPVLWGDLMLMGTSATVSINPEEFILPGQYCTITINDPDMNVVASRRDCVYAKILSKRTGDYYPLACLENGANTGVFTGRIGTVFGIEPDSKRMLSVLPGDILEIYYLDQFAAGGKNNTPLREYVKVARGIYSFSNR